MLAAVKESRGVGFVMRDVPVPELPPHWVLIRVRAVGICGTDVPIYEGIREVPLPLIPGHEFAGEVVALGRAVNGLAPGDRVTVGLVIPCQRCRYCVRGQESLCERLVEIGIHINGGFAEYAAVPARNCHRLAEHLSFREGASADPLASAYHAVRRARIGVEDVAVILGPGPIGLFALQLVRAEGARLVVVVGTRDDRLSLARDLGADAVVNVRCADPRAAVADLTGGSLAHAVIEATGRPDAVQTALELAGPRGRVVLSGIFHQPAQVVPQLVVRRELSVKGAFCYTREDMAESVRLLAEGKVKTAPLITHVLPLAAMERAMELVRKREAMKVILEPGLREI